MIAEFTHFVKLNRFSSRRRAYCLHRVLEELDAPGLDDLRRLVEQAIAAEIETCELEERWKGHRKPRLHKPQAKPLAAKLDRALSGLAEILRGTQRVFEPDSPEAQAARRIQERVFPQGVAALTRAKFVERAMNVDTVLRRIRNEPELQRAVEVLGLQRVRERIVALNARFTRALSPERQLTFPQLDAARKAGQQRLEQTLVLLSARFQLVDRPRREAVALRRALAVIRRADAGVVRYRKRRRWAQQGKAKREAEAEAEPEAEAEAEAEPSRDRDRNRFRDRVRGRSRDRVRKDRPT